MSESGDDVVLTPMERQLLRTAMAIYIHDERLPRWWMQDNSVNPEEFAKMIEHIRKALA